MAAADSGHDRLPDPDTPGLVPDDASALEPDRLAWLAEQRRLRRRELLRRLLLTRRWDRFGVSGPLVAICLLATTAIGALVVVALTPRQGTPVPRPAPLAAVEVVGASSHGTATGKPVGGVTGAPPAVEPAGGPVLGHRLPPTTLDGDAGPVASETLRPAVVLLLPAGCACTTLTQAIYRQAREFRVDLWLVAAGTTQAARTLLIRLDEDATTGGARWALDADGVLDAALAARTATLVTVRADGVLTALWRDLPLDATGLPALEPLIAELAIPSR